MAPPPPSLPGSPTPDVPPFMPALHPGGDPGANLKSISHRCHPILVAFIWELTKENLDLPLGRLHGTDSLNNDAACTDVGDGAAERRAHLVRVEAVHPGPALLELTVS